MKNIVFISEIQDPEINGSSTQIMTRNILDGFWLNGYKVHFIAITDSDCNDESVRRNYLDIVDKITIVKSKLELRFVKGKYKKLLKMLKVSYFNPFDFDYINEIDVQENTLLISHSPSIESVLLSKRLIEKHKKIKYYQYWSDPISLSGIYPEEYGYKRFVHYLIEKKMLSYATQIIYGTAPLYSIQKDLFSSLSSQMRYVDVSYIMSNIEQQPDLNKKTVIGYSGNYFSEIRNIMPLYNACKDLNDYTLLIYGESDLELSSTYNIKINNKRYSQNEIKDAENNMDIMVTILNSNCVQIPGKVFYHTNTNKTILVILDGKYNKEIQAYLEQFNRFVFCKNDKKSILSALEEIKFNGIKQHNRCEKLSPKFISKTIVEG